MGDLDTKMSLNEIEDYVKSLINEYEDLLWDNIFRMREKEALITFRKVKRLKKSILFILLRKNIKKG